MDKTFDPRAIEARWRDRWEADGHFKPSGRGEPYTIMIPPPNVTGTLHMGHAFQHTVMDALTRHARMSGRDTLWQPGTDHAGIATQMVVERNLKVAGEPSRAELGREQFVDKVWDWKRHSAGTINGQIRRMGSSVDWSREAFTMDEGYSKAVVEHFVQLHEAGLIYRGKRLVNWDPVLQTAISDLEVVSEEENGFLWHIRYPLADGATYVDEHGETRNYIIVATTRPETMLGDAAVAVHPEDERYAALVAAKARVMLPLCNRPIPIIADDFVDRAFGTGAVKITPAHDFNDYAVGLRHKLKSINIFTRQAKIVSGIYDDEDTAALSRVEPSKAGAATALLDTSIEEYEALKKIPAEYQGLDRFIARKQIVEALKADTSFPHCHSRAGGNPVSGDGTETGKEELDARLRGYDTGAGLIEKIEPHKLKVPRGDRSGAVLEPYLTDQWFVDLTRKQLDDGRPGGHAAITQPALDAFADGRIHFVPDNWINTYNQWLTNIQDWCISRQLWWGHRIPAWYDAEGQVYVGRSEEEVRARHRLDASVSLKQDEDVFDTWFSSDIWPLATLGWPERTPELARYYPTSVLVTGFDIIFFWVARMVMMGLYFSARDPARAGRPDLQVPFRDVFITGLVRDPEGNKMSKSKGNVLDPLDVTDGITLDDLVAKRTTGLMNPATAPKIEAKTRKDYPKGIEAVGVDALRFTFAALCTNGRDIRFDAGRAAGYRNFCNKIWNASRFVLMNLGALEGEDAAGLPSPSGRGTEGEGASVLEPPAERRALTPARLPEGEGTDGAILSVADRWIISRLQKVEAEAVEHFAAYRFDLLASCLYQFVWNEYCDWYLELTKPVLLGSDETAKRGTRRTLARVLEVWLRLLHPIMPFVTEDIWQRVAPLADKTGPTIMTQPWPVAQPEKIDEAAEADVEWLKGFILGVRQIRAQMDIAPGKLLPLLIRNAGDGDRTRLASLADSIGFLARVEAPRVLAADEAAPESSTALLGEMQLLVPMAGLIDKDAELARLAREIGKLEANLGLNRGKLDNPNFAKAPEAVQQKTRELIAQQTRDLEALRAQSARIAAL